MRLAANDVPALGFSWTVLFTLLLVLVVSVVAFVWQVRRWTTNRGWRALLDWSREQGFKLSHLDQPATEPFERMAGGNARVATHLQRGPTQAYQLEVSSPHVIGGPAPQRWHVFVRELKTTWPPTGARPSHAPASLLDQFSLTAYPRLGATERFTVFGTDGQAAKTLSDSHARALLPPDIGLLLHGHYMVLDFSTRPFDGIELGRMLALADQLEQHLPVA